MNGLLQVVFVVWLLTGAGAVGGSIVGAALGRAGLFAGALLGGAVASAVAVGIGTRMSWIARAARRRACYGAWFGFAIAAGIAALNLHTPVIPVLATSLAGIGAATGSIFETEKKA